MMNVTCKHCQAKINIPDEKIPEGKDTSFKCPKCKGKIEIKGDILSTGLSWDAES